MTLTTQQLKEKYGDKQIKSALQEMMEVMEFDTPPKVEGKIREQLVDILEEASAQIYTPDKFPDNYDEFSKETEQLIKDFGFWPGKVEEEQEEEPKEEQKQESSEPTTQEIRQEIEDATKLKQLKDITKTYDVFKKVRGELSKYKDGNDLRKKLIEVLEGGDSKEEAQAEEKSGKSDKKKEEKPKSETSKQSGKKKKGTGIIASIAELIENSGKAGITKEEILQSLKKKFPDRSEKSMKATINVQVPNRINKERFEVEKLDGKKYRKKK